jgi:hypothetical protein
MSFFAIEYTRCNFLFQFEVCRILHVLLLKISQRLLSIAFYETWKCLLLQNTFQIRSPPVCPRIQYTWFLWSYESDVPTFSICIKVVCTAHFIACIYTSLSAVLLQIMLSLHGKHKINAKREIVSVRSKLPSPTILNGFR